MNFTIKKDLTLKDDELIIKHNTNNKVIEDLQNFLINQSIRSAPLKLFKKDIEYFIKTKDILFFETYDNTVYAHTVNDAYQCEYRLYELEEILSEDFIRISKSSIVNLDYIISIRKNFHSTSTINFQNSIKEIDVSRKYSPFLKQQLEKRILKWKIEKVQIFFSV